MKSNNILRFTYPIITENILAIFVGLAASLLIGKISGSALAAAGISNTVIAFITSAFAMLTSGSSVLTARAIGANDRQDASAIIEQSILLTACSSLLITIIFALGAPSFIRFLMPAAEKALFDETVSFFRILVLSFPLLMIYAVLANIMRASGNSTIPMLTAVAINVIQLVFAYLFIIVFRMGLIGAGFSYIIGRCFGMLIILTAVLRSHTHYRIKIRNLFKPDRVIFSRIFRLGFPTTAEQLFVQGGYLVANAMAVGLGTRLATVYQVSNTVYTFFSLPQGICSIVSMVAVGQMIGAKEYQKTKTTIRAIWRTGLATSVAICLPLSLIGKSITAFYSSDASIIAESASLLWVLFILCIPALSINVIDPVLRSGGDTKFVLFTSVIGVWLIRIPLTYLFCYYFNLGVWGIFWANIISLFIRATMGMTHYIKGKWLHAQI